MNTNSHLPRATKRRPSQRGGLRSSRQGTAAVEFAMVAPLIFLFVFSGIEFGRLLMVSHGIEAAAREGCRRAISWDSTTQDVADTVAQRMAKYGISDYKLKIDPKSPAIARQWKPITVRITVSYDNVSWLPMSRYLEGIKLQSSCTLPQESDRSDS